MYLLDTNHCSRIIFGQPNLIQQLQVHSAIHYNLTVVSTNDDFQRIQQVHPFSLESWV